MKKTILSLLICFAVLGNLLIPLAVAQDGTADLKSTLLQAVLLHEETVDTSAYGLSLEQTRTLVTELMLTRPELFTVEDFSYTLSQEEFPIVTCVIPQYTMEQEEAEQALSFCQTQAQAIAFAASAMITQTATFLKAHELFLEAFTCSEESDASNAFEFFRNKGGNSLGAAMAFQMICEQMGMDSRVVTSAQMGRSWNTVSIDGERYHADLAADDALSPSLGHINRTHCLLSDDAWMQLGYTDFAVGGCTSDALDRVFWKSLRSPILYIGGYLYYLHHELGGIFRCHPLSLSSPGALVVSTEMLWTDENGVGTESIHSGLVAHNNLLYYNTNTQIMQYNPDTSERKVYAEPELEAGEQIFDLWCSDGSSLSYTVGRAPALAQARSDSFALPTAEYCTIIFISEGNVVHSYQLEKGGEVSAPPFVPQKESTDKGFYRFKEWKGFVSNMRTTEDKVFYAVFSFRPYPPSASSVPASSAASSSSAPAAPPDSSAFVPPTSLLVPPSTGDVSAPPAATSASIPSTAVPAVSVPHSSQPSASAHPTYGNDTEPEYSHRLPQHSASPSPAASVSRDPFREQEQPKDRDEEKDRGWLPWIFSAGGSLLVVSLIAFRETVLLPKKKAKAKASGAGLVFSENGSATHPTEIQRENDERKEDPRR